MINNKLDEERVTEIMGDAVILIKKYQPYECLTLMCFVLEKVVLNATQDFKTTKNAIDEFTEYLNKYLKD